MVLSSGKKVHKDCVPKVTCAKCFKIISTADEHVSALDKHWHNDCFSCTVCAKQLGSTFVQLEGKPHCQPCIQTLSKDRKIVVQ